MREGWETKRKERWYFIYQPIKSKKTHCKYYDGIMKLFGHKIKNESYEPVTALGIIVWNNGIACGENQHACKLSTTLVLDTH